MKSPKQSRQANRIALFPLLLVLIPVVHLVSDNAPVLLVVQRYIHRLHVAPAPDKGADHGALAMRKAVPVDGIRLHAQTLPPLLFEAQRIRQLDRVVGSQVDEIRRGRVTCIGALRLLPMERDQGRNNLILIDLTSRLVVLSHLHGGCLELLDGIFGSVVNVDAVKSSAIVAIHGICNTRQSKTGAKMASIVYLEEEGSDHGASDD